MSSLGCNLCSQIRKCTLELRWVRRVFGGSRNHSFLLKEVLLKQIYSVLAIKQNLDICQDNIQEDFDFNGSLVMKNDIIFKFFGFFLSGVECLTGLIFVSYPALIQEHLYPQSVLAGGEIGLIQMGWIHVGIGFWSGWGMVWLRLHNGKSIRHVQSTLSILPLWSIGVFKDLWSLLYLVKIDHWGGLWHGLHLLFAGVGIFYLYWLGNKGQKENSLERQV